MESLGSEEVKESILLWDKHIKQYFYVKVIPIVFKGILLRLQTSDCCHSFLMRMFIEIRKKNVTPSAERGYKNQNKI